MAAVPGFLVLLGNHTTELLREGEIALSCKRESAIMTDSLHLNTKKTEVDAPCRHVVNCRRLLAIVIMTVLTTVGELDLCAASPPLAHLVVATIAMEGLLLLEMSGISNAREKESVTTAVRLPMQQVEGMDHRVGEKIVALSIQNIAANTEMTEPGTYHYVVIEVNGHAGHLLETTGNPLGVILEKGMCEIAGRAGFQLHGSTENSATCPRHNVCHASHAKLVLHLETTTTDIEKGKSMRRILDNGVETKVSTFLQGETTLTEDHDEGTAKTMTDEVLGGERM